MSKFCSQCGTPLSEGARFCPSCGAPVQGEVAVQPAYENNAVPAYGNTPDVVEMQWNGYVEDKTIKAMFFTSKGRLNRKRYIAQFNASAGIHDRDAPDLYYGDSPHSNWLPAHPVLVHPQCAVGYPPLP